MSKPQHKISEKDVEEYRGQLLDWYDRHARDIPWRVKSGETANPYHVWLSEIMCQQTTVQAVKAYYLKFLNLWPTVHDLAAASEGDVMGAWAGLGYYARARNLHKCAKIVANDLDGVFPGTQDELKALPGIGDYTSAAIAAIAFNKPATVVDGNVERVITRLFAIRDPLPNSKPEIKEKAALFFEGFADRPGDLAQAFMDLGAGICIPKAPRCILCPLQDSCEARKEGIQAGIPFKVKKKPPPKKHGYVYWIEKDGKVLFHKRPAKGLLGGMAGLPTSEWLEDKASIDHTFKSANALKQTAHHVFTHFELTLHLHRLEASKDFTPDRNHYWATPEEEGDKLPTVFKKPFKLFLLS